MCVSEREKGDWHVSRYPRPLRQLWGHHCRVLGLIEGWWENIRGEGGEGAQLLLLTIITHNTASEGEALCSGLAHLWPPAVFRKYVWIHPQTVCVCWHVPDIQAWTREIHTYIHSQAKVFLSYCTFSPLNVLSSCFHSISNNVLLAGINNVVKGCRCGNSKGDGRDFWWSDLPWELCHGAAEWRGSWWLVAWQCCTSTLMHRRSRRQRW